MNASGIEVPGLENKSPDELRELVGALAFDPLFGCWTRTGFELLVWPEIRPRAKWVIFADLDRLHTLNAAYGYEVINRRIREAIQLRKSDVQASGRWFSGDELFWVLCDTADRPSTKPKQAAGRLQAAFQSVGMSATFGISRALSFDLATNVLPAIKQVQRAKAWGRRGTINQTGTLYSNVFGGRSS